MSGGLSVTRLMAASQDSGVTVGVSATREAVPSTMAFFTWGSSLNAGRPAARAPASWRPLRSALGGVSPSRLFLVVSQIIGNALTSDPGLHRTGARPHRSEE